MKSTQRSCLGSWFPLVGKDTLTVSNAVLCKKGPNLLRGKLFYLHLEFFCLQLSFFACTVSFTVP